MAKKAKRGRPLLHGEKKTHRTVRVYEKKIKRLMRVKKVKTFQALVDQLINQELEAA